MKDLLGLMVIVALVLVSRSVFLRYGMPLFGPGLYLAVTSAVTVLAWRLQGNMKAPLITYAVFAWIFGALYCDTNFDVDALALVGSLLGLASAVGVWIVGRKR
jgi:hypothetical protein